MTLIHAILLGVIQGLTEFIPVSSTAHLLLTQRLLGIDPNDPGLFAFDVLVQLGTLVSLFVYFRADLWNILRAWLLALGRRRPLETPGARMGWFLILGTIPAAIAGVALKPLVEALFRTPALEALIRLGITSVLLVLAERIGRRNRSLQTANWRDALFVGCAQVLAVFPGASRSESTIAGGMGRGFDRPAAARFAFLLSVPVMLAAGAYEALGLIQDHALAGELWPRILAGFIVAAVVGYFSIRWLIAYLSRRPLYVFAAYCALLCVITVIFLKA